MTPELPSSSVPALPVRRRETLEILDTALKLYRRYFWVLLGWSALVSSVSLLGFFLIFTLPLLYGAVSCCVAAAVRGQNVKFSQCWAFSKPRYGPLLGTIMLSYLLLLAVGIGLQIATTLIVLLGGWALANAPQPVQIVGAVVGSVLGFGVLSVVSVVAFGWTSMVPIVVCLEDDKRSAAAIGRAFDLLKGNWRRVFGLSLILGLAMLVVFVLVGAIYAIFGIGGWSGIFDASWGILATLGAFMGLFLLIWTPVQSLVVAVLYLDLRVRREALDLEWTAYASAPVATPNSDFAPAAFAPAEAVALDANSRAESPFGEATGTTASFAAGKTEIPHEIASEIAPPNPFLNDENEARRD